MEREHSQLIGERIQHKGMFALITKKKQKHHRNRHGHRNRNTTETETSGKQGFMHLEEEHSQLIGERIPHNNILPRVHQMPVSLKKDYH